LDAKQAEVNKMNEANEFYEDMRSRKVSHHKDGDAADAKGVTQDSESGNGETKRNSGATTTKDGIPSHAEKDVTLTPNG
jgi:autophagy-related protein 16-1